MHYLAAMGVMLLVAWVGLVLVAWRDRSLVAGAFALILLGGYSWYGSMLLVAIRNHPD